MMAESSDPLDEWAIVRAINEENSGARVFRLRRMKPKGAYVANLITALTITWDYDPAHLFPKGEEKDAMLQFERALDVLADGDESALVQVATGMGTKEWLYYVVDPESFVAHMNRLLRGHPRYPIKIEWYDDPRWELWRDTVAALKRRQEAEAQ